MAESQSVTESLGLNLRSICLMVIVVGAITGGNLWLNRGAPPLGYERYSGYGFSIEYRKDMLVSTAGLGGGSVSNKSGSLEGRLESAGFEQFGVIWLTSEAVPTPFRMHARDPEAVLEYLFASVELSGTQITGRGEIKTSTKDGHEIFFQYFNITEPRITIPGIIGAWYCDEDDRILMLYLIHVPDLNHPDVLSQDLEQRWQHYLDSLVCHSGTH